MSDLKTLPEGSSTSPPLLSDQFYKARKQSALFSGLLLSWVLIGFDLDALKGVTDGPAAWVIAIKTPGAIPAVLCLLVLYFLFRMAIEWRQCDPLRKQLSPPRLDYFVSNVLGLLALLVYFVQVSIDQRIGDILTTSFEIHGAQVFTFIVYATITWFLYPFSGKRTYRATWYRKHHIGRVQLLAAMVLGVVILFFSLLASIMLCIIFIVGQLVAMGRASWAFLDDLGKAEFEINRKRNEATEAEYRNPVEILNELRQTNVIGELAAVAYMEQHGISEIVL